MNTTISTSQLAKIANKTNRTIHNWAKKGKISYKKDESGNFSFDLSEVARVFPDADFSEFLPRNSTAKPEENREKPNTEIRENRETTIENKFLHEKVEELETRLDKTERKLEDEQTSAKDEREKYLSIIKAKDQQLSNLLPAPKAENNAEKFSWVVWPIVALALVAIILALLFTSTPAASAILEQFFTGV